MTTVYVNLFYILAISCLVETKLKFILLHNSDIDGRFDEILSDSNPCDGQSRKEGRCMAGIPRTYYVIKQHRKLASEGAIPHVLYLFAGNIVIGTAWTYVHGYKISIDVLNLLKPDVVALGHNEFNRYEEGIHNFTTGVTAPIVAANLDLSKAPNITKINSSTVLEIKGTKIGIVGHVPRETETLSRAGQIGFFDPNKMVKGECKRLKQLGVNIIIILGSSGYASDLKMAREINEADIVVGGRTATFLYNGPPPDVEVPEGRYPKVVVQKSGKKVLVVHAYSDAKYLGRLNVTFDDRGSLVDFDGQPILMSNSIPQDEEALNLLKRYRDKVVNFTETVVGRSSVSFEGYRDLCFFRECNTGNLIADAYVAYAMDQIPSDPFWTSHSIGLVHAGTILTGLTPALRGGNITMGDIVLIQPFGDTIVAFSIKGKYLLNILEHSVSKHGPHVASGAFLHLSGAHVVYDMKKKQGNRVVLARARCSHCWVPKYENIVPSTVYNVVAPTFIISGGEGHRILADHIFNKQQLDKVDTEVAAWYLRKRGLVCPELQERIKIIQTPKRSVASCSTYHIIILGIVALQRTFIL